MDYTYNSSRPYATLMRGRPDEPDSHQHLAVYSRDEFVKYRHAGWITSKDFMARVDRALRKDP